jgi:poly(hydroxyalkanoate) depolymerase family esterase
MRRISDTLARLAAYQQPAGFGAAPAGRLTAFEGFGSNPGALGAYTYVPPGLAAGAALVVVLHGCTQNAAGYDLGTGWSMLADQGGFALLFPEQRRANNGNLCFNWFDPADIARTGGEAQSIAQMVETLAAAHAIDRAKVFVTGLSAGGAMTAVMLATYPDLFAAGAIIGGLPYGCAATVPQALDRMRGHGGPSDADAAAAVRRARGDATALPAVSIWQGSADMTVVPVNADRLAAQWRGVHGLSAAPTETEHGATWEHRIWRDDAGRATVEQWNIASMGHGVPIDATHLGQAGPYMLDVGLSSTQAIAAGWGLVAAAPVVKPVASDRPTRPFPNPASGVQDMIEAALRSSGLLR